jgi:DNA-binding response OmpR family regulator
VSIAPQHQEILRVGVLEVRPREGLVIAAGRVVVVSARELELLTASMLRVGRVVSREELHEAVWGGPLRAGDRSVDVYVRKLRAKLERALPDWRFIHTHVGFGYRFFPEPSQELHDSTTGR